MFFMRQKMKRGDCIGPRWETCSSLSKIDTKNNSITLGQFGGSSRDLAGGFTGRASKQLAGEWESFKRQGEEEILIRPWISQRRSHFYNLFTVSLSLTNTGSQSALSHFTQDNFLKAAVGKREGVGVEGTAARTES